MRADREVAELDKLVEQVRQVYSSNALYCEIIAHPL